jgi:hypothetical protein
MNVLIACEYSGVVRDAFRALGHDAWSCDLLEPEIGTSGIGHLFHLRGDVTRVLGGNIPRDMVADSAWRDTPMFRAWDLMIAHPPCTYLARSGMRWLKDQPALKSGKPVGAERRALLAESLVLFETLLNAPIPRVCVENPRSFLLPWPATQYIQPWQFGHGEVKETGLWLRGLPPLEPTRVVSGREARVHRMPPGPDRWKERSRTFSGIAAAMAAQWGKL